MNQTSRISEYQEKLTNGRHDVEEWATDLVEQKPMVVMCSFFAAGFVLGVGIVSAMASQPARPRSRMSQLNMNSLSEQWNGLSERIADAVSKNMPKQVSDLWSRHS